MDIDQYRPKNLLESEAKFEILNRNFDIENGKKNQDPFDTKRPKQSDQFQIRNFMTACYIDSVIFLTLFTENIYMIFSTDWPAVILKYKAKRI